MEKTKKIFLKTKQGSVLAYSLVILSLMLAIAASLSIATTVEKKSASATEFSMQSIQTADSGLQIAVQKINDRVVAGNGTDKIDTIFPACVDNAVADGNFSNSYYKLTFYTDSACTTPVPDCTAAPLAGTLSTGEKGVACIRSVGTYKNTVRAVSSAIAPPVLPCSASTSAGSSCSFNGLTYGVVAGDDGRSWFDRNLGATQVATAQNDNAAYGWYFQWGRNSDGHQISTSGTTGTNSAVDNPGHANFITEPVSPYDWRIPQNNSLWQGVGGTNNPCPAGFRIPTQAEWNALVAAEGISNTGSAFNSNLKLTAAGIRRFDTAIFSFQGASGYYWSSTISGTSAASRWFHVGSSSSGGSARALGFSVRCIKD